MNVLRMDQSGKKGDSINLPSGSRNLHVSFGEPPAKKQVSLEAQLRLKTQENFSSHEMKAINAALRVELGRGSVEPGLMEELPNVKYQLADFFKVQFIDMTRKKGEEYTFLTHPLLYSSDVEALVMTAIEERGLDPDQVVLTVGIDDGQQFLKVVSIPIKLLLVCLCVNHQVYQYVISFTCFKSCFLDAIASREPVI